MLWFPWQQDVATTTDADAESDAAHSPSTQSSVNLFSHGSLEPTYSCSVDLKNIKNVSVLRF